jgi:phage major head subunit gpT-like protein
MGLVLSTALDAIKTEFDAIFNDVYKDTEVMYPKIAMTVKSNTATSVHGWMERIKGVREWIGPRNLEDASGVGYSLTNQTWENTIQLKKSDVEDDQVGLLRPAVQLLGSSAKAHPDQLAVKLLKDNGLCYDGIAFFGTHTWGGRSVENTGNLALDPTNFSTVKTKLRKQVGLSGTSGEARLISNPTFQLVVSPDLEDTARAIVEAPFANFGATNIFNGKAEVIVLDDLSDGTQHRLSVAMPREAWRRLLASERDSSDNCIIATPVPYVCAEDGWPIVQCDLATEKGRGYLVAVQPAPGSHRACFAWYGRSERYPDAKAALWGLLETNAIGPAPAAR